MGTSGSVRVVRVRAAQQAQVAFLGVREKRQLCPLSKKASFNSAPSTCSTSPRFLCPAHLVFRQTAPFPQILLLTPPPLGAVFCFYFRYQLVPSPNPVCDPQGLLTESWRYRLGSAHLLLRTLHCPGGVPWRSRLHEVSFWKTQQNVSWLKETLKVEGRM